MISALRGTIACKDEKSVVIDAAGVGYRVFASLETLAALPEEGEAAALWTHLAVREDSLTLFGFIEKEELNFFELLINIPGIGPKTALAILGLAPVAVITQAIAEEDAAYLTKVSGIGKKNAEKIVLELKGKIGNIGADVSAEAAIFGEDKVVLEAIKTLGYSVSDARAALKQIPKNIKGTNDKIKAVLRKLGEPQ